MQVATLGSSGLRVPRVGLGCRDLGGPALSGTPGTEFIRRAIDLGLTFFDTADVYSGGESERLLGKALAGDRDRCVIATKFRHSSSAPGASRKSVRVAVDGCLRRLGVDYVDLFQLHRPDPATPLEETVVALQDQVHAGKILYFGLCNASAWQAVHAQHIARASRWPLATVQVVINPVTAQTLHELGPVARKFDLGLLAACPLARGLLGGRYDRRNPPPAGHPLLSRKGIDYWNDKGLATLERVREVARALGVSPARATLEAALAFPEVSAVLVGARSVEQLAACAETTSGALDGALLRTIWRPDDRKTQLGEAQWKM
jgi:1-deoxyxylulose-5-phosphate synthase